MSQRKVRELTFLGIVPRFSPLKPGLQSFCLLDSVVAKPPKVIKDYRDIMEWKAKHSLDIYAQRVSPSLEEFSLAEKGSV